MNLQAQQMGRIYIQVVFRTDLQYLCSGPELCVFQLF